MALSTVNIVSGSAAPQNYYLDFPVTQYYTVKFAKHNDKENLKWRSLPTEPTASQPLTCHLLKSSSIQGFHDSNTRFAVDRQNEYSNPHMHTDSE